MPGTLVYRSDNTTEVRPFMPLFRPGERIKIGGDGWVRLSLINVVAGNADFVLDEAYTVEDVYNICRVPSAGSTVQVQTGGGVAITDAMAAAVANTRTAMTTIDETVQAIAASGTLRVAVAVATALDTMVFVKLRHT